MTNTNISIPIDELISAEPKVVYILAGLLAINCIVSVVGNILILYTFFKEKPLAAPLRIILSHLAITNILIASIGEPMVVISGFNLRWVFGDMGRKIEAYVVTACGLQAMSLLALVSIERYLRVTPGQRHHVTEDWSVRAVTAGWMYNLVYASVPFYGVAGWQGEGIGISNSLSWDTSSAVDMAYVMTMMMTGYFIPLSVIAYCYNRILHFVKQAVDIYEDAEQTRVHVPAEGMTMETQLTKPTSTTATGGATSKDTSLINPGTSVDEKTQVTSTSQATSAGESNTGETQGSTSNEQKNRIKEDSSESPASHAQLLAPAEYSSLPEPSDTPTAVPVSRVLRAAEKKISNVVVIIIVSFFVSWTPYAMVNLLVTFDKAHMFSYGINATIPSLLAKTSTVWSPIIYCAMNGEIRTANLKTLSHLKRRLRILYFGGI